MFRRQSRLCHLFVLNRIKKVRFSTKSLHISAFLPIFAQNFKKSDYGKKQHVISFCPTPNLAISRSVGNEVTMDDLFK